MTATANATRFDRLRLRALALALLFAFVATLAAAGEPVGPDFSKEFMPDTIGPGSVSMLIFTIDNSNSLDPVGDMAFDDELPFGMELAAPAFVSNTCAGTVEIDDDDADSAFDVRLTDGAVGLASTCTIVVNVTGPSPGEGPFTNITGDLTSDAGNSGTAEADLMVSDSLPGFTKSFDPSTIPFGGRSTLTFTIDNSANEGDVEDLSFTDTLPPGMAVADPALASTDCENPLLPAVLTAVPGTSFISLAANGTLTFPALEGGETCTVTVDVIGGAVGFLGNVTSSLLLESGGEEPVGKAAAVLEVTGTEDLLELSKEFTDDPVAPGGTVTLEFTVTNKSRDDSATAITFSDDLEATLTGLTPTLPPTPDPPCGAGSVLSWTPPLIFSPSRSAPSGLTLTGGSLPPEGSCTFSVQLAVPADATPGTYPNAAGPVTGEVGGSPETGNVAGDLLFVVSFPILTKEFTDDPVGAGGTVTLEFTITNPEADSTMSGIEFVDELTAGSGDGGGTNGFLPFPVSVTLPPTPDPPCGDDPGPGPASSLTLVSLGGDRQGLMLENGFLEAAGDLGGGDSCTFSLTVDIPSGLASGTYTNTTEEIIGVLDDFAGSPTVTGPPASDDIVVVGAPQLSKEFTDDPAVPGGTVTLLFTLENLDPDNAASLIAFSDDLGAALAGLTVFSVDVDTCGGTPSGTGTDMFGYSGGSLAAEATCTISLTLTVPTMVGGIFGNTTSDVSAEVAGLTAASPAASDDLVVAGLLLSKEFTDDPVIAGGTATLRFTLDNVGAVDATGIAFSDSLSAVLPGMTTVSAPPTPCGGTLLDGTTFLSFSGGSVLSGAPPCSFDVTVLVPATVPDPPGPAIPTPDDSYVNTTSGLSSSLGTGPPAVDFLVVDSTILEITKEFTDDPVEPDSPVTLEFTLTNLSATETVTDIAFDDDLDSTLTGLTASGAIDGCGGTLPGLPTGFFSYTDGTLLPGASCTITVTVDVPPSPLPGNLFPNTTTGITGKVGALDVFGDPASDELSINSLVLTKSFDGSAGPGDTAVLTFTLENLSATEAVTDLAFTDNLDTVVSGLVATGLPANPVCDTGAVTGSSIVVLTGASLDPEGTCTFDVTVTVPVGAPSGSFLNTTSSLRKGSAPVADPATAFLTIIPPPTFVKVFAPDAIGQGSDTTLTFTIDNTASTFDATGLAFLDTLPFDLRVAAVPAVMNTCGGAVVAAPLSTTISLSGGTLAAGAACTISVQVNAPSGGSFENTTDDLTSSSGNSGMASDTLAVAPCLAADGVNLTFDSGYGFLAQDVYEVCNTIAVKDGILIFGPNGVLTLRAGVAVIVFEGSFLGQVTFEIDPSLIP